MDAIPAEDYRSITLLNEMGISRSPGTARTSFPPAEPWGSGLSKGDEPAPLRCLSGQEPHPGMISSIGLLIFTLICGLMTFLQFCSDKTLGHRSGWWDKADTSLPYSRVPLDSPGTFRHVSRFVTRTWTYERLTSPNPIRLPWREYTTIDQWVVQNNEAAIRSWLNENTPGWTARGYDRDGMVVFSFRSTVHAVHFGLTWA